MKTIPFFDFFKGKLSKGQPVTTAPAPPPPAIEKQSGTRLSKTVMPSATRTIAPPPSFPAEPLRPAAPVGAKRPYSLGTPPPGSPRTSDLPPAVAFAIEPKVERVIGIELAEVVSKVPEGWVRPVSEAEGNRRILLKAAELEKGMSSGKPTVSIASIYQQVPEIFVRPVPAGDGTQVPLPFAKILEEFKKVQQRADQSSEQSVPQVETPFLKVTLEDNSKFGVKTGPIQMGELAPVRLVPATAEAIAAATPEATAQEFVPPSPPPISMAEIQSIQDKIDAPVTPPPPEPIRLKTEAAPPAPTRIPFKLSPTGPDAPASERVPASSGPSVPTGAPAARPRVPFKLGGAPNESSGQAESWLTKDNFSDAAVAALPTEAPPMPAPEPAEPEAKISLLLKPILQSLPPFQLSGDAAKVPEDERLEVPFSLVEPQLVSGRVSLTTDQFAAALPEKYKSFFSAKEITAPVMLPLQEVLKSLPDASLQMRDDQVEQEKSKDFATPFSAKAEEDAKRFNLNTPVETKPLKGMGQPAVTPATEKPALKVEKAASTRSALQIALDTDDVLDAKAVVAHVGKMAGIKACAIMFGDGLSLAGNLPEAYQADGLCAMAPSLLEKIESHMGQTKLGPLRAVTLSCAQAAITFFRHDNLCLAALHAKDELAAEVRERLARALPELSKEYSNPV